MYPKRRKIVNTASLGSHGRSWHATCEEADLQRSGSVPLNAGELLRLAGPGGTQRARQGVGDYCCRGSMEAGVTVGRGALVQVTTSGRAEKAACTAAEASVVW